MHTELSLLFKQANKSSFSRNVLSWTVNRTYVPDPDKNRSQQNVTSCTPQKLLLPPPPPHLFKASVLKRKKKKKRKKRKKVGCVGREKSERRMTASVPNKIQTHTRFKRTLFIRTNPNIRIRVYDRKVSSLSISFFILFFSFFFLDNCDYLENVFCPNIQRPFEAFMSFDLPF